MNRFYAWFCVLTVAGLSLGACAAESSGAAGVCITPETAPGATPEQGPQRIHFGAGATSATVNGTLPHEYILPALAGQTLSVDVAAPWPTTLGVSGKNGTVLALKRMDETNHWEGRVPSTQDYLLELGLVGLGTTFDYTLTVTIPGPADPTPAASIYRSTEYGFAVEYLSDFGAGTCPVADGIIDSDLEILFLRLLGDSYYGGTNLLDACVVVTVDGGEAARSTCQKSRDPESPAEREDYLGQEEINGVEFSVVSRGGATTRHTHELTGYRTLHAEACYEVILFLHYRNLGTYAPGAVSGFDRDAVMDRLKQVLYSMKMLPPEEEIHENDD